VSAPGTGGNGGGGHATVSVQRLEILEAIGRAALSHVGFEDLARGLLVRVTEAFRADTAGLLLLDEASGELVARAAHGLEEDVAMEARVPLGRGFAGRVAAQRRPIAIADVQEADIFNPLLRAAGLVSLLGVPLVVDDKVTGVLHVGCLSRRHFDADDTELLELVADRIALAIEHARLYDAERRARAEAERAHERVRRIESVTDIALAHLALDDALLRQLLMRVRDILGADTAAILLLDEDAHELVARAACGLEEEVERGVRIPLGAGFAGRVAAERAPVVLHDLDQAEVVNPLLREKGIRSMVGVPLLGDESTLGVLHVGTLAPRSFSSDDIALLELAADRIAVGLAHSHLHEREHQVAAALHRTLLPERLPEVTGVELAARYVPGAAEGIGGDWYDVIPLPRGEIALVIGDVVSRGLRAASVTSQIRNSLRAYAIDGDRPRSVLERLNRIVHGLGAREMATVLYLVLDVHTLEFSFSAAGHPPPLVVSPDGGTTFLEGGRSAPLGAVADPLVHEASGNLAPGSTLLLYTDGLVERRDMWIDEGLRRLEAAAVAATGGRPTAEELCDVLLARLEQVPTADDVALLAARSTVAAHGRLALSLPAEPTSLAPMRRTLRGWLVSAGADEDEVYDLLVATTEAAANAVEHAYGPVDALFEVEASADDDEVTIVVRDFGEWRPPRGRNRGRGTLLMKELTDHYELSATEAGTEVRLRRSVGGGAGE
jgi:GAF domain-containing protein/anti-sigma regulatory factor (Ser/Thr protein kinase)